MDNILFRASSTGHLMVEPLSKNELISETTKKHLIDVFVSEKYGRKENIVNKVLTKGNVQEQNAITLVSRINKKLYIKNEERLKNEFIMGTPDLYEGESIFNARHIIDTKVSWSAHTFFRAKNNKLNPLYYWQGQSYMWLTGAKEHTVAYCLLNNTEKAINDEKRKLSYSIDSIDFENDLDYIESCKQIEINHIFDLKAFIKEYPHFDFHNNIDEWRWDIPKEDRIFTFNFKRNDEDILRLKNRVIDCRNWINENLIKV